MKKTIYFSILCLFLSFGALADDGTKKSSGDLNECWEGFNRASFALNEGLDKVIFKPVASVYKKLPSPVKSGVSNSLNNLSESNL